MQLSTKLKLTTLLLLTSLWLAASPARAQNYAECGVFVQPGQICPPECPVYDPGTNTCKVGTTLSCGSSCTAAEAYRCPASCPCTQTPPYAGMFCGVPATPTPPGPPGPGPDDSCNGGTGIKTGLGCIPTDPTGLVEKILQIAIGVASGIAMLLLIAGAFKVLTSSGDPKAVMDGKETITSAIAGLLLILLSVAILNIIGIQILGIPIWKSP